MLDQRHLRLILMDETDAAADYPSRSYSGFDMGPRYAAGASSGWEATTAQSDHDVKSKGRDFVLSLEECQIITLIVAGYSTQDIARHFSLSESTIRRRTVRIIGKLGVSNRFELILFALSLGMITWYPRIAD